MGTRWGLANPQSRVISSIVRVDPLIEIDTVRRLGGNVVMCRRRPPIVVCGVPLGRTVPFLAIVCVLFHDPLFALKLGNLERVVGLVRAREERLHSVVLELRLGRRVRFIHHESVCTYPLGAV